MSNIYNKNNSINREIPNIINMTKTEALAMEQYFIQQNGLFIKGGKFKNTCDAISKNNFNYNELLSLAYRAGDYFNHKNHNIQKDAFSIGDVFSINTIKGKFLMQYVDNYLIDRKNEKKLLFKVFYKSYYEIPKTLELSLKEQEYFYCKMGYFNDYELEIAKEICDMQKLGNYLVQGYLGIPQYTKSVDVSRTNKLIVRLFDKQEYLHNFDLKDEEKYKNLYSFDEMLIEEIAEKLSTDWTHTTWVSYQQKILDNALKQRPELIIPKLDIKSLYDALPIKIWLKNKKSYFLDGINCNKFLKELEKLLSNFLKTMEKAPQNETVLLLVKALVKEINALDDKYRLIETTKRESLIEFFAKISLCVQNEDILEIVNQYRTW